VNPNHESVEPGWLLETLEWAQGVAREAGAVLREHAARGDRGSLKQKRELITEADHVSEELILGRFQDRFPDHSVRTEETGGVERGTRFRWWVDPLDGTNSFAHGHPHFSISMALEDTTEGLILGVVYDPMRDECFAASTASAAALNGRPIRVSETNVLAESLVATGFPYDREADNENNLPEFNRMILAIQGIRRGGSAALDLSYVAAGRLDAYWEFKLKPWDVAAGSVIVRRAGGRVTNIGHDRWDHTIHHVAASNGLVHAEMQQVLAEAKADRMGETAKRRNGE
jgi:myo-inositol-1(or 4)-monophosphatase